MAVNQKKETKKKVGISTIVLSLVQTVFILALVLLSVITFGSRMPLLKDAGLSFYAVTSGSMEPAIPTGSIISVGNYDISMLETGDIITFSTGQDEQGNPKVVTHRIVEVSLEEEQQVAEVEEGTLEKTAKTYGFTTRGDANNVDDDFVVRANNILGKYQWHIPYLGYLSSYAQTEQGFVAMVIAPATILVLWEVASLVGYFKRHYQTKADAEVEELKKRLAEKNGKD